MQIIHVHVNVKPEFVEAFKQAAKCQGQCEGSRRRAFRCDPASR